LIADGTTSGKFDVILLRLRVTVAVMNLTLLTRQKLHMM